MAEYELRSKPKPKKDLITYDGEIRINELRYQAFVNPVFHPPSPNQDNNSHDSEADSVHGAFEEIDRQHEKASRRRKAKPQSEPSSMQQQPEQEAEQQLEQQAATEFQIHDTAPLRAASRDDGRQLPKYNISRLRRQPLQSPYSSYSPPCEGPYRAYSPRLYDDPSSSVAMFTQAHQFRDAVSPVE